MLLYGVQSFQADFNYLYRPTIPKKSNSVIDSFRYNTKLFAFFILIAVFNGKGYAQCPPNMDFESGTFAGWKCWVGTVDVIDTFNMIRLDQVPAPIPGQHTILSALPGDGLDEYGGFPKNCPNGSGHSIKLGNDQAGGSAEGISYDFVIPPTSNKFSITYNYALVFEDPDHERYRQPRLVIQVIDLTDDALIDCFTFSYIAYGVLPGFSVSPLQPHQTPVRYKPWTENTVYLNGYQGKTIRLFIKTADCAYALHFGYAYVDVSSKCENSIVGETYCAQDSALTINAPSGYQNYNWFNSDYTQVLGTQQTLTFQPPPVPGTVVAVELLPYPGFGCRDTLVVDLRDTLTVKANAGADLISCNQTPVQLGTVPVGGVRYQWTPSQGLNNPNVANPIALPQNETTYYLTATSMGGNCISRDTVKVAVKSVDSFVELLGNKVHCVGQGPDPVLKVGAADNIQWFKDSVAIPGANQATHSVKATGTYYAILQSNICTNPLQTQSINMTIDTPAIGVTYPLLDVPFNFPVQLQARGRDFASSVLWTPAVNLDKPNTFDPYFKGVQPQTYLIELKSALGCITIDTQVVKTHKEIAIYVPSVFTPDGDGKNDYLRPLLLGFEKLKYFRVFNRWGKLIFETQSELPGWNGRVGNQPQETQAIVWMLEAVDVDGKSHFRKGSTLLMH